MHNTNELKRCNCSYLTVKFIKYFNKNNTKKLILRFIRVLIKRNLSKEIDTTDNKRG